MARIPFPSTRPGRLRRRRPGRRDEGSGRGSGPASNLLATPLRNPPSRMPSKTRSPGARLRAALKAERPLQVAGTINAYCALLAERAGFRAIYLSGAGVANASHGVPDVGITTLGDVCEDVRRITRVTALPLLVDA